MKYFKRAATALAMTAAVIAPSGLTAHAEPISKYVTGNGSAIANTCSGKKIREGNIGSGGRWQLFYSSAAGGTNCVKVFNMRGGKVRMLAGIYSTTGPNRAAIDLGNYWSYAGASKITGTKGQCVGLIMSYGEPGTSSYGFVAHQRIACG